MLETATDAWPRIAVAAGTVAVMWALGRGIGVLVRRRYLRVQRPSFAHVMSRVVSLALTALGLLAAVTIIFPTVKPVNVLGSLGFFSIAVGFAFRDILENLLAGLLLLFRAPFRMGDEVDIDGTQGTVVEINLRETVLRTYEGRQVLVPNATVYKNRIVVQTGFTSIRSEALVGVAYETDLAEARSIAVAALQSVDGVLARPAPAVLVEQLGESTIELKMLFWTAPQQATVLRVRDAVLSAVSEAYKSAGIEMPADIVVLQGTPSLKAALRDDDEEEPTPGGGVRRATATSRRARGR